ncbi:helix-turn-helix transcriptional regulator [Bacillus pretiosus]
MPNHMTLKEVSTLLNLSIYQTRLFLKEALIQKVSINSSREIVYDTNIINNLRNVLEKRYKDNCLNKYTPKELITLGCTQHDRDILKSEHTELFDRYRTFTGVSYFYDKLEVNAYLASKNCSCELLSLSQIMELVGFKTHHQLQQALNDCDIKEVKRGYSSFKYYKESDIKSFIDLVKKRYSFNKANRLSTQQVQELGFKKNDRIVLQKVKAEHIDRINEYAGVLAFYDKVEVEGKLKSRKILTHTICEKDAKEHLGYTNTKKFKKVIQEYDIALTSKGKYGINYYDKSSIDSLKNIIDKNYEHNLETKITGGQIKALGYSKKLIRKLTPIHTRPIDNVYKFASAIIFYDKEQFLNLKKQYHDLAETNNVLTEYYTSRQLMELLDIPSNINRYMAKLRIPPIKISPLGQNYWPKDEIDDFVKRRTDLYNYYNSNYYLISEVEYLLGYKISKFYRICSNFNIPVISEELPIEVKFKKFYKSHVAFPKDKIDAILARINDKQRQITTNFRMLEYLEKEKNALITEKIKKHVSPTETNQSTTITDPIDVIKYDPNTISETKSSLQVLGHLEDEKIVKIIEEITNYSTISINEKIKTIISEKDLIIQLDYSRKQFDENKENFRILKLEYENLNYYLLEDCSNLLKKLYEEQNNLLNLNYTYDEAIAKFPSLVLNKNREKFQIPSHLRFGRLKKLRIVYPKKVIDDYLKSLKSPNLIEQYKNELEYTTLPDKIFLKAFKELGFHFPNLVKGTEKAWHNFVSKKLLSSNGNIKTIKKLFVRFIKITELLQSTLISKEIMDMTSNEINFVFLNNKVPGAYKESLYSFFNHLFSKFPNCKYLVSKLNNPHVEKKERLANSKHNKKIYSTNEFLTLLDYVKDSKFHKENAISEYKAKSIDGTKGNYESIWLYVMLHLNNGWRSTDFIEKIPRIPLSIPVQDYKSFENHNLTLEEAAKIIWELKSNLMNVYHNKNGKKAFFFISEDMIVPVANAIVLCELKAQLINSKRNNLIDLGNSNELTTSMHDKFFRNFPINNFKFKSLMANSTFITFVNSILKQKTNRNPLEITKFIRNHDSLDTTNRYVHVNEEHLNKISKQLFDKGYFGYTYDYLKQIVIGESQNNFMENNEKNLLATVFGDIYKIENFSIMLNAIEEQKKPLYEFVKSLSQEQQREVLDLINMNQLPAKESFWQCILGDCLYLDRKCNSCPFAIPHFYVLTKTVYNLNNLIPKLEQIKNISYKGERVRLANLLYKNLSLISTAKKQFGENVLSSFLGKDYSDFLNNIRSLDSINENLTIGGN